MTDFILETQHLSKAFGGIRATDDLDLQVLPGRTARRDWPQRCRQNNLDFTALRIANA